MDTKKTKPITDAEFFEHARKTCAEMSVSAKGIRHNLEIFANHFGVSLDDGKSEVR